jgi:hypothetical protein
MLAIDNASLRDVYSPMFVLCPETDAKKLRWTAWYARENNSLLSIVKETREYVRLKNIMSALAVEAINSDTKYEYESLGCDRSVEADKRSADDAHQKTNYLLIRYREQHKPRVSFNRLTARAPRSVPSSFSLAQLVRFHSRPKSCWIQISFYIDDHYKTNE